MHFVPLCASESSSSYTARAQMCRETIIVVCSIAAPVVTLLAPVAPWSPLLLVFASIQATHLLLPPNPSPSPLFSLSLGRWTCTFDGGHTVYIPQILLLAGNAQGMSGEI